MEEELNSLSDFTQKYNKWFREFSNIEDDLSNKSTAIQTLENNLHEEAEKLKRLNENTTSLQIEQNYIDDLLNVLIKEQNELAKEIKKLDENAVRTETAETENLEESSILFESIDSELKSIKENIKNLVLKINSQEEKSNMSDSPFPTYRTILDHYADALTKMDKNTLELEQQFDALNEICLMRYIPSNLLRNPHS